MTREQRTVFGEVAAQYDETRPGYPDTLFETVVSFGELQPGDRALEIGAGTGKATRGFAARGLAVTALEPSPGMVDVLRAHHTDVVATTFEDWSVEAAAFRLLFAAQSWHWVDHSDSYRRAAEALQPGGTLALFWNLAQPFEEPLGADLAACYETHARDVAPLTEQWPLDAAIDEINATTEFGPGTKRTIVWNQPYSTEQYVALMGTHSSHRMLDEVTRGRLQDGVRAVLNRRGGCVDVVYHTDLYLARRQPV